MIIVYFCAKRGAFCSHNEVILAKKRNEFVAKKTRNQIERRNLNRLIFNQ